MVYGSSIPFRFQERISVGWFLGVILASTSAAAPPAKDAEPAGLLEKPQWQRLLTGEDAQTVERLEKKLGNLENTGRFAAAIAPAKQVLAIRKRRQGTDHWETVNARIKAETCERGADLLDPDRAELAAATRRFGEADQLSGEQRYREAESRYRDARKTYLHLLGKDHPATALCSNNLAFCLNAQGKYDEAMGLYQEAIAIDLEKLGEDHPATAMCFNNIGENWNSQGKYLEAEPHLRRSLATIRRVQGDHHLNLATCCESLAYNLGERGRLDEAERLFREALEIRLRTRGESDPSTLSSYGNLGYNLTNQSKYSEAEPLLRKTLEISRRTLGEDHPGRASFYDNLARSLHFQGRQAEAEVFVLKALAINRHSLGEDHPFTIVAYHNLGENLGVQGKYAEAQPLLEKAMRGFRRVHGADHPWTATACNNLAKNLDAQGKYREAEPLYREALEAFRRSLGEDHHSTAVTYSNWAANLRGQWRYTESEQLLAKAIAIDLRVLGERHPATVAFYNLLGENLAQQGRHAEAESRHRKALAISGQLLGEGHPNTILSYWYLARELISLGKYSEAETMATAAAKGFETARLQVSFTGIDRALFFVGDQPLSMQAALLARRGEDLDAWQHMEASLARGLFDDLEARRNRPLEPDERRRQEDLVVQLNRLNNQIVALAGAKPPPEDVRQRLDLLNNQRLDIQGDLTQFEAQLVQKYKVAAGRVFRLDQIQSQLPVSAALVGWLDLASVPNAADSREDHWAWVVRHSGAPQWVRIEGSGPNRAWTWDDNDRPRKVRQLLSDGLAPAWQKPLAELAEQRLKPLEAALQACGDLPAVRHIVILPSPALAGIPIEALLEARPKESPRYLVSYAPSGTMFAWLQERRGEDRHKPARPRSLLALGDPVPLPAEQPNPSAPQPPDHGLLVRVVQPGSNAAAAGIESGDVILRYDGSKLTKLDELEKRVQAADPKVAGMAVAVWRQGKTLNLTLRPGRLGVELEAKPAAEAILAQRQGDDLLRRTRGSAFGRLPGARREVQAIAPLFDRKDVFLGSDASEQLLADLHTHGRLSQFSVIHLAAHGRMDDLAPMNSRLLLSQDRLPDPTKISALDQPYFDGTLTAGEVMSTWKLNAELVVLSACQSGLGRSSGGEGFIGFAQAMFLAGGRSLVLSLWEVDDRATALLMTRFYQNWLGKRDGLAQPMPKAEALGEAKQWLRGLTSEAVEAELSRIARGIPRAKRGQPVVGHPFEHPHYWAGFILMGDPY